MKIAIIGYGKMGRMIESIARDKGHTIGSCIDINNQELLEPENLSQHDVVIEFTRPETAEKNISKCLDAGVAVVSGTTGWTENLESLKKRCIKEKGTFLYASNFSLGVNILFHMNQKLASIMNHHPQYEVKMREVHHTQKLDAPSGTALSLADDILAKVDRKTSWTCEEKDSENKDKSIETLPKKQQNASTNEPLNSSTIEQLNVLPGELMIEAFREGEVPGIHEVVYESEFDEISLRHSAKDRRGFAMGAVLAAEFIHDKKGLFTMKNVLDL